MIWNFDIGDVGGLYPSVIQAMLPRLLAASAPPGNSAHENRRQCLKASEGCFNFFYNSFKIICPLLLCSSALEIEG